jgi:hypothetical protein
MKSEDFPGTRHRTTPWFDELADHLSEVDGSVVVWLRDPARPVLLPRQRRPDDGYRTPRL